MTNRWLRCLALALLLALAAGVVPAMAEVKILTETLYAKCGDYHMQLKDLPDSAWGTLQVKSSDPRIIAVKNSASCWLTPRKKGTAKITVDYEVDGQAYSVSVKFTVENYPNPIKSFAFNGKKVSLKGEKRIRYDHWFDDEEKAVIRLNVVPADGWKIAKIKAYTYPAYKSGAHKSLRVKNNGAFTVKKNYEAVVTYMMKNTKGAKFNYTINLWRAGE